ncbi:MAG: hypothetical protein P794_04285 [Epsilonproteobacteria bacterium (ex Lamellibrachia satsuma)]|nr:MAG: hypothetical protein P794_04285 [Epsilonproteobacteria bacterium (ex Lamellibrachia satsuma)]
MNLINDIYYNDEYISLYLKKDEELFSFKYEEEENIFINKTIKRPIRKIGNIEIDDGFYDLETAYGYGGFYTNSQDQEFIARAMNAYKTKCNEEKIIAEFIRFHPFNNFPIKCNNFLDFNVYDRDVVVKKLSDDIFKTYNAKVRNTVKRATEKVLFQESENIAKFMELYNATMLKNNASNFYFFEESYYKNLLKNKSVKLYELLYEEEIIAMGFFMFGKSIGHYHLSANTPTSYKINANYALLHNVFQIAQDLRLEYFMLGGGTTSEADDSLLKFKKKFSKDLKPFYISGNVYNKEIYDKYNEIWKRQSKEDITYFLKYRLEI